MWRGKGGGPSPQWVTEYSREGALITWGGKGVRSLLCQSPHPCHPHTGWGERLRLEMGGPQMVWQTQTRKKHELYLRKGLLSLFGTVHHGLGPRDQETKMVPGSHLAPTQARFWEGREPGKGIEKLKWSCEGRRQESGGEKDACVCVRFNKRKKM